MAIIDTSGFERVPASELSTGFYADIKRKKDQPKKKLILIRTPKNITAADLDGVQLDITGSKGSVGSSIFAVEDAESGSRRTYQILKGLDGELAPMSIAVPSNGSLSIEKGFAEVWHMGMAEEKPVQGRLEVDLEDDLGARAWRQVSQATNLRVPLSAVDIVMKPKAVVKDDVVTSSPSKKSKKRKHE